ncbi:SLAM family member 5-like [Puntigrus tetrazona]|uniref:SLAM family member 5-like n=1 Tax=Puntigrus tetrazona TaxID=1606681 RepID=UPI001C8A97D5|nr:SLAM family member 5-like [Puntigrus tetrazona]
MPVFMKTIRIFDLFFLLRLVGAFDAPREVPVMVGDSVTLDSNASEIERANEVEWRFNDIRIANFIKGDATYHERFKDRLKLDRNGSLTIKDTRITDTGVFKCTVISTRERVERFRVTIYAPLSIPVVTSDTSQCSSSSSSSTCSLLCSVVNVSHVTLSWYKGNSLLSSISVSDLSISLSLPLEVEYQEKNTYSCVINNPIRNQTRHVCITDLCRLCSVPSSNEVHYGEGTEAVIRLVVTALVGVAAVAAFIVLVYDIRSRRVEKDVLKH